MGKLYTICFIVIVQVAIAFSAPTLSSELLLPVNNGRDAYTPAAAFGAGEFMVVWQSGRILPGDLRNGPNYQSNIVACRISGAGEALDNVPFVIADTTELKQMPRIAFGGDQFLVVWQDLRNGVDWDVYAARVKPDGEVLDPNGILVAGGFRNQALPRVAWDGINFNVVWMDGRSDAKYEIYMARVSSAGTVLEPNGFLLSTGVSHCISPVVAPSNTDGRVFVFNAGGAQTFTGNYQFPVSPTTGKFVTNGTPDGQAAYTLLHTDVPALLPMGTGPLAIAKGNTGYLLAWRTDIPSGRGTTKIVNNMAVFDLSGVRKANMNYGLATQRFMNPDLSWDGNDFLAVWHERYMPASAENYESVIFAKIAESGELADSIVNIAGTSSAPALEPCIAADPLSGTALIAYEKQPVSPTVPITIAYKMTNTDKSQGYISITLIDSVTGSRLNTPARIILSLSGNTVANKESSTGVLRVAADSGDGYLATVRADGYAAKVDMPVHLEGGKTLNLTINLTRLPIIGIDIMPDTLVVLPSSEHNLKLYSIHSDSSRMAIDTALSTAWLSRSAGIAQVSNSGRLTIDTTVGTAFIVAEIAALSLKDSSFVRVVKRYQAPLFYWKLDENSGTVAMDATGQNNTATLQGGATWTSGRYGSAVSFDGTDDYLSTSVSQSNPSEFTLSLWFKTTSVAGGKLIGFGNRMTGTSTDYDRDIAISTTGTLTFRCYPGSAKTATTTASYNDGAWHHVAATLSASSGMQVFVDGVLAASEPTGTSGENFTGYWKIGFSNAPYYNGQLDDIRVYGMALSVSEIASLIADSTTYFSTLNENNNRDSEIIASLTTSPNPFNPSVNIKVKGWKKGRSSLKIMDLSGRVVSDLTVKAERSFGSGNRFVNIGWNASGRASGVYFVNLRTEKNSIRNKIILVR